MSPREHPIAYLLILCDELQEWDRVGYGILDRTRTMADDIAILITDQSMDITYITSSRKLPAEFPAEKESLLDKLLEMNALFPGGFSVGSESTGELALLAGDLKAQQGISPRPLMENMEKLAIEIHKLYNQKSRSAIPGSPLNFPIFPICLTPSNTATCARRKG